MDKKIVQFSSQIDGVKMKKDRTLEIKLGTQELPTNEMATIFDFAEKQIWVSLAETALTEKDINIPEALKEFPKDKSDSERLRNVLFIWWKQNYQKQYSDFESFRKIQMGKIIDYIKDKLE